MRIFTLAAGLATGYVLGSRAGREQYHRIVAHYEKVSSHPTVVQAQEKARQALSSRTREVITKLDPTAPDTSPTLTVNGSEPRPARRTPASRTVTPGAVDDPLV